MFRFLLTLKNKCAQGSYLPFLVALLFMTVGCGSAIRSKGFSTSNATEQELSAGFEPRQVALLIGIDSYDDEYWPKLRHASSDAQALGNLLAKSDNTEVIVLNTPETTTRQAIFLTLKGLSSDLKRRDSLILYFSGHGTVQWENEKPSSFFLVSQDAQQNDLQQSAIDLDSLLNFVQDMKPQRKVMIFDSCFSADGKSSTLNEARLGIMGASNPWLQLGYDIEGAEAILLATHLGGSAHEDDTLGHGIYTYGLIQSLTEKRATADTNGDGAITAWEAHDHARSFAMQWTQGLQTPEAVFRVTGRGDVYLDGIQPLAHPNDARIYAYNTADLSLRVDGRARGSFPRTVSVDPGRHHLEVSDSGGKTVAQGTLQLSPTQDLSVDELVAELGRPQWLLGLQPTYRQQLIGPASAVWGENESQLALSFGHQVRGGNLRGLFTAIELGFAPNGTPKAQQEQARRNLWSAGLQAAIHRGNDTWQWGSGVQVRWTLAEEISVEETASATVQRSAQPWLLPEAGPLIWAAHTVGPNLWLTSQAGLDIMNGSSLVSTQSSGWQAINVRSYLSLGMHIGF